MEELRLMKYLNTKTGAIIDSPCIIKGGDWVEKAEKQPAHKPKQAATKQEKEPKEG
jgi:hypothetical protein